MVYTQTKTARTSCALNSNMKQNIKERWHCFSESILDANQEGVNMSIPAYLFLGMKAFILKKVYVF